MNNRRQFIQTSAAAAVLGSLALPSFAQPQTSPLPLDQVRIINGFPVGGSADTTSRRVWVKSWAHRPTPKTRRWSKTKPVPLPALRLMQSRRLRPTEPRCCLCRIR